MTITFKHIKIHDRQGGMFRWLLQACTGCESIASPFADISVQHSHSTHTILQQFGGHFNPSYQLKCTSVFSKVTDTIKYCSIFFYPLPISHLSHHMSFVAFQYPSPICRTPLLRCMLWAANCEIRSNTPSPSTTHSQCNFSPHQRQPQPQFPEVFWHNGVYPH